MDDLNLLLTALATGTSAGLQQVAGSAIKDAYTNLKELVKRKFASQPTALTVLTEYETDPDTYEKPLRKAMGINHLEQDEEIMRAAHQLMALVQPQQASTGKYNIQITGSIKGQVIGDRPHVIQHFDDNTKD